MSRRPPEDWQNGYFANAERIEELARKVDELIRETASKQEIQAALDAQTRTLRSARLSRFTFRLKVLGTLTALLVVGLQIYIAVGK
jgi:hypothetical protein